jgi:hypothetical protein
MGIFMGLGITLGVCLVVEMICVVGADRQIAREE